ncbi:MAG TPA: alpha-L-arabinofuranosidase C-terminal domain-containing protein [Acidobacteriaceae bacterium]|nr:alpha-L-arabinofuranosidase C-terminal domain-containing protein [Acidobacteriaceae bacterium]
MFRSSNGLWVAAAGLLLVAPFIAAQQSAPLDGGVLQIHSGNLVAKVSPTLYGLMTEEINHSYDGGIYAELVQNRAFQDNPLHPVGWTILEDGNAQASIQIDHSTGPSTALASSLKLTVQKADRGNTAGIVNGGYWGIPLRANTEYAGSFYAKVSGAASGPVEMSLVNDDTGAVVAKAKVPTLTNDWKQYTVRLHTGQIGTSARNHLTLSVSQPGTVWFSLVSLFPPTYKNTPNGNRIDLMEKLDAMHPAFLRLPGGNYLEGNHLADWYNWKKTIGPLVDRSTHPSPWSYHSSDGMGLLEFLQWCEDLHMQPVLAVYAGYSLKHEHVNPGSDLTPYVQSALDEIEYVTGGPQTKWGAVRAKDGHPAPFPLTYVEIGNEDWFDTSGSYDARFAQFFDAIRKAYPQLKMIATTAVKSRTPDVIDDHFYRTAQEMFADTHHYDKTSRNGPKIFVGEWATREGTPTPNLGAALADAAWMTGMERNSDVVVMSSYAPLLTNVNPGAMQWAPDLIGYDAVRSYGSPSYYAQAMFSRHLGTEVVDSSLQNGGPLLFYSVTEDKAKHKLYLKVVNASSERQKLRIQIDGAAGVNADAAVELLSGHSMEETNSLDTPSRIVPVTSSIHATGKNFQRTFPPYSVEVMTIGFE